jgi:glycosyltransferase involved in cell wall biosynthesis
MTEQAGLVSIVVAFLNEERFLEEAVASVYAQTYPRWELLLADDGSTDRSSTIAQGFAARDPERVRYLEHASHQNRGASATRNLGVGSACGEWVAFLDGDDVWLPERLARSMTLARENPGVDMVYARTQYWHSWQGNDGAHLDRVQPHYFGADRLVRAPELLVRHLSLRAALPCMGSLLVRRRAFLAVGGFEESFRGLVDDAVFLGKFCLHHAVYVSNECWDRYRQHPESDTAVAAEHGRMRAAQRSYLSWLNDYVDQQGVRDRRLRGALQGAVRRLDRPPGQWRSRLERRLRRAQQWCSQW